MGGEEGHTAGLTFSCLLLHETQTWHLEQGESSQDNEGYDKTVTEIPGLMSMNYDPILAGGPLDLYSSSTISHILHYFKQKHSYLVQTAFHWL